ncbi:MAG TPA: Rid family hydrolase [Myxococcota bacterium]|nr:Rid family hydrolase [Myxococcota bacterium]
MDGPEARELFLLCQPVAGAADAGEQAEAIYRAALAVLEAEGGSFEAVVCETLFVRSLQADLERIRAARDRILAACSAPHHRPAITEIEQPPLSERALEVSLQAVLPLPTGSRLCVDAVSRALRVQLGDEVRLYAGGLYGAGDAYQQTLAMFGVAEELLQQAGMEFRDVVRTWIHLREIDRDYADLNRARRAFFESRGIEPAPASTGVGGGPVPAGHDLCLGVYAVRAAARTVMSTSLLNDAASYGADFERGIRLAETNKVALHVSGTASIDAAGRTAHPLDFEAQATRMLQNVSDLLAGQGAGFADVVSAITYLRHPADAGRLRNKLREAGFEGFPHALVAAPLCRPDLLCETEALAVLSRSLTQDGGGKARATRRGGGEARD